MNVVKDAVVMAQHMSDLLQGARTIAAHLLPEHTVMGGDVSALASGFLPASADMSLLWVVAVLALAYFAIDARVFYWVGVAVVCGAAVVAAQRWRASHTTDKTNV